ncbi:hypothetical protein HY379_02185, partial [Candidatus Saccharibacteria bacterium]|nr:hypothetical protein [Candidatus Saccharibacteria bacterium]
MATAEKLDQTTSVAETEKAQSTPEVNGKHLEAAFIYWANHHKDRLLSSFGSSEILPVISGNVMAERLEESEKRYRKLSSILH